MKSTYPCIYASIIPIVQYILTIRRYPECDTGDLCLGLLLGTIPWAVSSSPYWTS